MKKVNTLPVLAETAPSSPPAQPKRLAPVAAVSTAILGVLTAIWPEAPIMNAVTTAVPQLQIAIPLLLTSIGSIFAVFSRSGGKGPRG